MLPARTEELTRLLGSVGRVLRHRAEPVDDAAETGSRVTVPNTIVLSGEAGIGKTTLLETFVDKLKGMPDPPTVVEATCSTPVAGHDIGEVEALAPWMNIVAQLGGEAGEAQFHGRTLVGKLALAWVRCIPVVGDVIESAADTALILKGNERMRSSKFSGTGPAGSGVGNQEQMFRQCINLLRAIAKSRPLVVIIDDMHWADTSSTNLLFTAARELQNAPIAFVPAYRPDEASTSRGGAGHPIVEIIGELGRYSLVETIPLSVMDAAGLNVLLRARYGQYEDEPDFERWLRSVSAGNPLFITQYLSTLEEDGTIDRRTGHVGPGYRAVAVPPTARAVIAERLRRLDDETLELLRYASVEGETFSTLLLAKISEVGRLAMLRLLRRAESDHRIIKSLGKQTVYGSETTLYRFDHELIRQTLYESLGEEEREVVHEAMLDVLVAEAEKLRESGEMIRELGPRIAAHADILGRYRQAAEAALEGAESCWLEYAVDESLRLVDSAIRFVEKAQQQTAFDQDLAAIEARARRTMGRILRYKGEYEQALPIVEQALAAAERSEEIHQIVGALIDRVGSLRYLERHDEAERSVRDALERAVAEDFSQGQAGALNALGTILHSQGNHQEAVDCYLQAIDLQRERDSGAEMAKSYSNLGNAFKALGDTAEASRCYQKSLEFAAESDSIISYGVALLHLGNVAPRDGDPKEAIGYYEESREIGERIGHRELAYVSSTNLAAICRESGRLDEADTWVEAMGDHAGRSAPPRLMAEIALERGRCAAARAAGISGEQADRLLATARASFLESAQILRKSGRSDDADQVERYLADLASSSD